MRTSHWLIALAVLVLVLAAGGWRIYNASLIFPFRFPGEVTLGGWLGGGLQWHFAAMWLPAASGLVYPVVNISTRPAMKFLPLSLCIVLRPFRNNYRPVHYLMDVQKQVRLHHFGEDEYDKSEQVIQQLLDEAKKDGKTS